MIGETLGRYKIVEHLGRGGMAEVFKAYHPGLERYVAVKVLHSFLSDEENFLTRFRREAKAVAALRHPNIIQLYDFDYDKDRGLYFMVMEFAEGPNLKVRLRELAERGEHLPVDEAVRIAAAVGRGLDYAHRRGMIHRDVKPANIMFTGEGQIVLTDFGIAKMVDLTGLTASGAMVGTPAYISPEQGLGQAGDARSDIYSLGVVLYQMLTGSLPFEADTSMGIVLKHINEPFVPPSAIRTDLPDGIERVVARALAKDPAQRYQTAGGFAEDLDRGAAGLEVRPPPSDVTLVASTPPPGRAIPMHPTPPPGILTPPPWPTPTPTPAPLPRRRRSRLPAILGMLIVFLLAAASGILAHQGRLDGLLNSLGLLPPPGATPTPGLEATSAALTLTADQVVAWTPTATSTPTLTPTPTSTPTPAPDLTATVEAACVFEMELLEDVPIQPPVLAPAQPFTKAWGVRNAGTCAWRTDFQLVFVFGNRMEGPEVMEVALLEPGEEWDIVLTLRAPTAPGAYAAAWQLQDSAGEPLGERLKVEAEVGPLVTPATPAVTSTTGGTPTTSLEMSSPALLAGTCRVDDSGDAWGATLCWDVRGGTGEYHYFYGTVDSAFELGTYCHEFTAQRGTDYNETYFTVAGSGVFWPLPGECCTGPSGYYRTPEGNEVVWYEAVILESDCSQDG